VKRRVYEFVQVERNRFFASLRMTDEQKTGDVAVSR
jgi:hypothetical protein